MIVSAQQRQLSKETAEKAQKKAEKKERINQLIKQEEEGGAHLPETECLWLQIQHRWMGYFL